MDANTLTAIFAGVGVAVAIWIAYQQNERARFSQEIQIVSQLDSRFDSPEFRLVRGRAAAWLAGGARAEDQEGVVAIRSLVDFFETLGYLHRREVISSETAWHYFGSWILPYYEACKDFIRREQDGDPNCYTEFVGLREAVFQVEREKRSYIGTEYLVSSANVDRILSREIEFHLSEGRGHRGGSS